MSDEYGTAYEVTDSDTPLVMTCKWGFAEIHEPAGIWMDDVQARDCARAAARDGYLHRLDCPEDVTGPAAAWWRKRSVRSRRMARKRRRGW